MWGDDDFDALFSDTFDTLDFEFEDTINVENLIDRIEAMKSQDIKVEYDDTDLSRCQIHIAGFDGEVNIFSSKIQIASPKKTSPSALLEYFKQAQQMYIEGSGGAGISPGLPAPPK